MPTTDVRVMLIKVDKDPVCGICALGFGTNVDLVSHITEKHFSNVFHCNLCDSIRYETKEEFVAHVENHGDQSKSVEENTQSQLDSRPKDEKSSIQAQDSKTGKLFHCHLCGTCVTRAYDLKRHLKTHDEADGLKAKTSKGRRLHGKVGKYKQTLNNPDDRLTRHVSEEHSSRNVKSKWDGIVTKVSHPQNNIKARKAKTFPCNYCGRKLTRAYDLKRHIRKLHPYLCPDSKITGMANNQGNVVEIDEKDPNLLLLFPPPPVMEGCGNPDALLAPNNLAHQTVVKMEQFEILTCLVCKKVFSEEHEYVAHRQMHSAEEVAEVEAKRVEASELSKAVEAARVVVDGRTVFKCAQCKQHLTTKHSFASHLDIHSGVRRYMCPVCGRQFRISLSLLRHVRHVHEGLKNHACDICGRSFANSTTVRDHRRTHTGERPCVCHVCGKAFKTKASLFVHSRFHKDVFPFECSLCQKRFRIRQRLDEHVRLHTGEKPHVCKTCGKAFRLASCLKNHRLVHERKMSVKCQICGIYFTRVQHLKIHVETHFD